METRLQLIKQLNEYTDGYRGNVCGKYGIEKTNDGTKYHIIHVREYGQDRKKCIHYLTWEQLRVALDTIIEWEESR